MPEVISLIARISSSDKSSQPQIELWLIQSYRQIPRKVSCFFLIYEKILERGLKIWKFLGFVIEDDEQYSVGCSERMRAQPYEDSNT